MKPTWWTATTITTSPLVNNKSISIFVTYSRKFDDQMAPDTEQQQKGAM